MNVQFVLRSMVRMSAHQTHRVLSTRLLRMSGFAALFSLAATMGASSMIQSGTMQTIPAQHASGNGSVGNPQNGLLIFRHQGCDRCHGSQGEGLSAPGPTGGHQRIASTSLELPHFIQLVRKPTGPMPPFDSHQVSDAELTDVYAFLHSSAMPAEPERPLAANARNGQQLFTKYGCYECHLRQGEGSRVTGPRLGPPQIPLSAFVTYVRAPTGEMPPYTEKTVPTEELAAMYAYLQSLPQPPSWKTILLLNQ